jgi:O-methyltransferase
MLSMLKRLLKRSERVREAYANWLFLKPGFPNEWAHLDRLRLFLIVKPYTLLSYRRLSLLHRAMRTLRRESVGGDIVELGVCNGGSAGLLGTFLREDPHRQLWLFDSWEGMPEATGYDISCKGEIGQKGTTIGQLERVEEVLFDRLSLDEDRIHLVRGWFEDTVPLHEGEIDEVALLHIDCDWYESVRYCLGKFYDRVSEGGFVVIDDYGYWQGCRVAVDEFFAERGIRPELVRTDHTGVYFRKTTAGLRPS